MNTLWVIIACGALSIVYGVWAIRSVMAADAGNARMQEIAAAIREGATAYLSRQYTTIAIVGVVVFVAAWFLLGGLAAVGFAIGAILSGAAGFIGMLVSVRANVRTAQAASQSLGAGLEIAFKSGAITGLLVAGLALLGVAVYFTVLTTMFGLEPTSRAVIDALVALGFGASLISIFARLGGGIFTKGADVGGDLVGKVEAGIPEDDPRNPATIADNVGDNVGDCAGMAADLFETYAVTVVATMVLASIFFTADVAVNLMVLPLAIGASCVITSIIGTFFVKLGANNSIMGALYKGFIATAVLSAVALAAIIWGWLGGSSEFTTANGLTFTGRHLFYCGLVGLGVTGLIIWVTEYYTGVGFRPVRSIAQASVTVTAPTSSRASPSRSKRPLCRLSSSSPASSSPSSSPACSASPSRSPRCWRSPAWSSPSTLSARSPTMPAALPKWPTCRRKCASPPTLSTPSATPRRRSPRATPSALPVSAPWCCSRPIPRTSPSSRRTRLLARSSRASRSTSRCRTPTSWSACSSAASCRISSAAWA